MYLKINQIMKYTFSLCLVCFFGLILNAQNWENAGGTKIRSGKRVSIVPVGAFAKYYPDNNYLLSVDGGLATEEILIQTSSNWPDFVFLPAYQRLSLAEVEKFIEHHGHLPGIPSQTNIDNELHGLGEIHRIFLQKVEELTLYLIESHERKVKLRNEIKALETELGL